MNKELLRKLEDLERIVIETNISEIADDTELWGRADVIISEKKDDDIRNWLGNQPLVLSYQESEPRRRAVITSFAKELSWLFYQLRAIFSERVDYSSKYDFYGLLAQSAIDYIDEKESKQDLNEFLQVVIEAAKSFL